MSFNDTYIEKYFDDVTRFSQEHVKDLEKFNQLLGSLQGGDKDERYKNEIQSLQGTVKSFNKYLEKNSIVLSDMIKNNITSISQSGYTPIVKKRMIEDVIEKIKSRYELQKNKINEEKESEKEISELQESRSMIADWFRLLKFAYDFSTITFFSHHLKDTSLSIMRKKAVLWHENIEKKISEILDTKYFLLSNLEYNSLELILQMKMPLYEICRIGVRETYEPRTISAEIDSFARLYLTLIKNSEIAESSLKKILQNDKSDHGLFGILKTFIDQPIYENKPVFRSPYDKISKSITGFLLSYYTSREKIVIRTVNQIMYLLAADGKLDNKKKNLTEKAVENIKKIESQQGSADQQLKKKFIDMNRVIDNYLDMGSYFEERIFRIEAKNNYSEFMAEIKNKPLLRIIRLVEGYSKYITDTILSGDEFIVEYDNVDYAKFYDLNPEIIEVISRFTPGNFDLIGSKTKEMEKLTNLPGGTSEGLIHILTDPNLARLASNPTVNFARTVLMKLSEHSYHAGQALNQLISGFYNTREVIYRDQKKNYDFFINGVIKRTRNFKISRLFNRDKITVREFLEAACSLAFHIAHVLNNISINHMIKERDLLKKKIDEAQVLGADDKDNFSGRSDIADNDIVVNELDEIYRDNLTKLWKIDYLNDQVLPKLYNDKNQYKYNNPRYVFKFEIDGFQHFNEKYGHNNVDILLVEISRIFRRIIEKPGKTADDVVIRYGGGIFIGYLNDMSLTAAVEVLREINREVKLISSERTGINLSGLDFNFGIYEERPGTDFRTNIEIAGKILQTALPDKRHNIGFMRDPNYSVVERDFGKTGDLITRDLVTLVQ